MKQVNQRGTLVGRRSKRVPQDGRTVLEKAQESKKMANLEVKRVMKSSNISTRILSYDEICDVAKIVDVELGAGICDVIRNKDMERDSKSANVGVVVIILNVATGRIMRSVLRKQVGWDSNCWKEFLALPMVDQENTRWVNLI